MHSAQIVALRALLSVYTRFRLTLYHTISQCTIGSHNITMHHRHTQPQTTTRISHPTSATNCVLVRGVSTLGTQRVHLSQLQKGHDYSHRQSVLHKRHNYPITSLSERNNCDSIKKNIDTAMPGNKLTLLLMRGSSTKLGCPLK